MLLKVAGARSAEQPGMRDYQGKKGRNFDAGLLREFDMGDTYKRIKEIS